ncbi:sensor histidine kinase [Embleya scabrispora]|uniref:sensor histidine kinase n=1 Tax=Embleya scabrispora TaxID=159449 RepID=UPI001FE10E55|nr:histidine kinase [Embleya scabrispora]
MTVRPAREQEARARRAVTDERVRIARELHDVVAHHVSVISVQAGLAEYVLTSDPPTAEAALRTIGETTRETLDEMRRMLMLPRADGEDALGPDGAPPGAARGRTADDRLDPAPGPARLHEVVCRIRAAGVDVPCRTVGIERPLSPGIELCAYRIVQEALTNVLERARTARVDLFAGIWAATPADHRDRRRRRGADGRTARAGSGHNRWGGGARLDRHVRARQALRRDARCGTATRRGIRGRPRPADPGRARRERGGRPGRLVPT